MIEQLNKNNVFLNDVKLNNILIDDEKNLVLIDYEDIIYHKYTTNDNSMFDVPRKSIIGTGFYMAPETVLQKKYTYKSNVY